MSTGNLYHVPENASTKEESAVESVEKKLRKEFCHDQKIVQTLRATKKEECTLSGGISTSPDLVAAFAQAEYVGSSPFAFSVGIENEQLVERSHVEAMAIFEEISRHSRACTQRKRPDVPDGAHVRGMMVYASSKAALVRELGDFKFVDILFE
ncbi:UNVERIFIED_CONTAM: hypothetical protein HDU68_001250 [Siphonaria sp. JEL0065]|nr:hypothetical protein HDU68_001250 [Siphonaria sp. JEL0065]